MDKKVPHLELKVTQLNQNVQTLSKDLGFYEKIVFNKIYSEHMHEFQEIKRLSTKVKTLQEELRKMRSTFKEQTFL